MSGGVGEIKELRALVAEPADRSDTTSTSLQKVTARSHQAESELVELRKRIDVDILEDTVIAISAAALAYLGNHGRVKATRYNRHKTWAV